MKKISTALLCLLIFSGSVFSQTVPIEKPIEITKQNSSKTTLNLSQIKKHKHKTSDKESGILVGAAIGAGAGVLFGIWAGGFSLEPSNDKKASFGEIIVCGVVGAAIGGIVGGLVSK